MLSKPSTTYQADKPGQRKASWFDWSGLSQEKRDTLFMLITLSLVVFPHFAHLPLWCTSLVVVLFGTRLFLTLSGKALPSRWVLLVLLIGASGTTLLTYQTILGRDPGVTLLILMLSLKQLEMHGKRDAFVVFFLSFFVLLTQFFYSQSIGTAFIMLLAVLSLLTTLISLNHAAADVSLGKKLRLASRLLILGTPLMIVLFLFFPRIQGPLWSLPSDARNGQLGLSDTMSPGSFTDLLQSDAVAFRVQFLGDRPPSALLYWRGPVLAQYDGQTWHGLRNQVGPFNKAQPIRKQGKGYSYAVTLEPNNKRWLLALDVPVLLPELKSGNVGMYEDLQIMADQPIDERTRYELRSYPSYSYGPLEFEDYSLQDYLTLPPGYNPQTLAMAMQWQNEYANTSNPDKKLVQRALDWFHNDNFRYTMTPSPMGKQAIDDFLFSKKAGLCEHYAGAFVVLMRALDIPARVVTGYQGGEYNTYDNYMIVRQSDAHAWAEVWLTGQGWVRIDPTSAVAPERIDQGATFTSRSRVSQSGKLGTSENAMLRSLKLNWDSITHSWNQWVLSYSADKQRNLLDKIGFENGGWKELLVLLAALIAIVMLIILLVLQRMQARIDPVVRLWQKFCQQLERRNMAPLPHEGASAFAARIGPQLDAQQRRKLEKIVRLYQTLRYGPLSRYDPGQLVESSRNVKNNHSNTNKSAATAAQATSRATLLKAFKQAVARY